MTVVGIALRSLRQRLLSTVLTSTSVGLGVALVVFVFSARDQARRAYDDAGRGYDVVLGGIHTSALASVLSTVFHVDKPTDVVPIEVYEAVRKDPRVAHAVPYALGDVYRGFRVVGTTPELFDAVTDADGKPIRERVRGRVFGGGEEFEAVVGGLAAARTGLVLGSKIRVTHGTEAGGHEHDETWEVVGILDPTGTPNDRAVFITLESFFRVKGHEGPGPGGEEAGKPWAVSSIDRKSVV